MGIQPGDFSGVRALSLSPIFPRHKRRPRFCSGCVSTEACPDVSGVCQQHAWCLSFLSPPRPMPRQLAALLCRSRTWPAESTPADRARTKPRTRRISQPQGTRTRFSVRLGADAAGRPHWPCFPNQTLPIASLQVPPQQLQQPRRL